MMDYDYEPMRFTCPICECLADDSDETTVLIEGVRYHQACAKSELLFPVADPCFDSLNPVG